VVDHERGSRRALAEELVRGVVKRADRRRVEIEEARQRAVDVVDLRQVDGVAEAPDPRDVLLGEREGRLPGEREPLRAAERDERAPRIGGGGLVHAPIVAHSTTPGTPRGVALRAGN